MSHARDVSRYYDFIYLWSQVSSRFKAFSAVAPHTIHRAMVHPKTGEMRTDAINDLIATQWGDRGTPDALDAGCGYGGTALELQRMLGGRFHGVTINNTQIRIARRTAKAMGVDQQVSFERGSYDDPLPRKFNLIYGIESMVHSAFPERTIANLSAALQPGGLFIIVDDMPINDVPERFRDDLARFKAGWRCPILPTADQWCGMLVANGLTVIGNHDLTPLLHHKPEEELVKSIIYSESQRTKRKFMGLGMVTDAQIGGLMLERLNRERIINYRMLVARKN
jgi:SAM-dependent methyltransferase